ncbi:MAG TPA: hypothetical protein VLD62_07270, partial [Acidimicrobiia bacterium]|nr:hypothetical protein [Acidimicrobiia bacterium]
GVAAVVVVLLGWVAYGLEQPVPMLDWFDLAIHEAGHLIAFPLPELAMFLAGSVLQVAVPIGLAWYFWVSQRDRAAVAFCLAWAGTSARDVAVYVADARAQELPLVGGGRHDWAYILGRFEALDRADAVAGFVAAVGLVMIGVGLVVALASVVTGGREHAIPRLPGRRYVPPVRRVEAIQAPVDGDPWYPG